MLKLIENHFRADYDISVNSFTGDLDLRRLSSFPHDKYLR